MNKQTKWRSKEYLDFIRGKGCLICGRPAVPHHWRNGSGAGIGQKPDDCFTIPLCGEHHRQLHDDLGHKGFAEEWNFDPWWTMAFLMREYFTENL